MHYAQHIKKIKQEQDEHATADLQDYYGKHLTILKKEADVLLKWEISAYKESQSAPRSPTDTPAQRPSVPPPSAPHPQAQPPLPQPPPPNKDPASKVQAMLGEILAHLTNLEASHSPGQHQLRSSQHQPPAGSSKAPAPAGHPDQPWAPNPIWTNTPTTPLNCPAPTQAPSPKPQPGPKIQEDWQPVSYKKKGKKATQEDPTPTKPRAHLVSQCTDVTVQTADGSVPQPRCDPVVVIVTGIPVPNPQLQNEPKIMKND
jgi:hypothetical protein